MVHRVGFEPTHPKIPHLKCGALDHSANDAHYLTDRNRTGDQLIYYSITIIYNYSQLLFQLSYGELHILIMWGGFIPIIYNINYRVPIQSNT